MLKVFLNFFVRFPERYVMSKKDKKENGEKGKPVFH